MSNGVSFYYVSNSSWRPLTPLTCSESPRGVLMEGVGDGSGVIGSYCRLFAVWTDQYRVVHP
jgi:hypothetical protein